MERRADRRGRPFDRTSFRLAPAWYRRSVRSRTSAPPSTASTWWPRRATTRRAPLRAPPRARTGRPVHLVRDMGTGRMRARDACHLELRTAGERHQRARRREHRSAAQERDRSLAARGVPPPMGAAGNDAGGRGPRRRRRTRSRRSQRRRPRRPSVRHRGRHAGPHRRRCRETGQPAPATPAEFTRTILDSLALKWRTTLQSIEIAAGIDAAVIHLVGGGAAIPLLSRLCASACERPVLAGPVEATVTGNALVQAVAAVLSAISSKGAVWLNEP